MTPAGRLLRELGAAAGRASDAQLLRLVGVLDRLSLRLDTDAILDPVRPRLRALRPDRPLNLARVLFLPMDAVLMSTREWRGVVGRLPRSAIGPLVGAFRSAEPALAAEAEAAMAGRTLADAGLCGRLGERLWPAAAAALPPGAPPGWAQAGLPPTAYPGIHRMAGVLWRHGPALWTLRQSGRDGPPEDLVRPVFRTIGAEGSEAVGFALAALLPFASRPAQLIALVGGLDRAFAAAAEQALDAYLEGVTAPDAGQELDATAAATRRFAGLIEDLERGLSRDRPRRAQRLQALRNAGGAACAARVAREIESGLLEPLNALLVAGQVSDAEVEALEARARGLRDLAEAGRRLLPGPGADRSFERALARLAAASLRLPPAGPGFVRADALRLVEILAGPEAAARLGGG